MQQKTGNIFSKAIFIALIVFFIYFAYKAFSMGFDIDVFASSDSSNTYSDMMWAGLIVSFFGCIPAYLNIKKDSSFLRGINIGIIIGVVIIAIAGAILAPN